MIAPRSTISQGAEFGLASAERDAGRQHSFLLLACGEHVMSNLAPGGDVGVRDRSVRARGGQRWVASALRSSWAM